MNFCNVVNCVYRNNEGQCTFNRCPESSPNDIMRFPITIGNRIFSSSNELINWVIIKQLEEL